MTSKTGRAKVREEFMKNAHVQDIRVIDMLVIKVILGLKKKSAFQEITPWNEILFLFLNGVVWVFINVFFFFSFHFALNLFIVVLCYYKMQKQKWSMKSIFDLLANALYPAFDINIVFWGPW